MSNSDASVRVNGPAARQIRLQLGPNLSKVANEVGISVAYLSQIERGVRPTVSAEVFSNLCRALLLGDRRAILADPYAANPATDIDDTPVVVEGGEPR